jgi:predicted GIY-YIG superfamily endonuclease
MYVYILQLQSNRYYCGITNNLERRVKEHKQSVKKHIQPYLPIIQVYYIDVATRVIAHRIEKHIKGYGVRRYLLKNVHKFKKLSTI